MSTLNPKYNKLYLFDIDGTLLKVKRGFMHELIERLLADHGMRGLDISKQRFAGRTDRDIFSSILQMGRGKVDESLFQAFKNDYIRLLKRELLPAYVHVMEHVTEMIDYFVNKEYHFGLLTGNFRESAYIKLQKGDIDRFFKFGAFGSDHVDRNDLPAIAHDLAQRRFNVEYKPHDLVIIGDTPKDIACAHQYGATSVAVATGGYSREELARYKPDYLLNNLSEPANWLRALNQQ